MRDSHEWDDQFEERDEPSYECRVCGKTPEWEGDILRCMGGDVICERCDAKIDKTDDTADPAFWAMKQRAARLFEADNEIDGSDEAMRCRSWKRLHNLTRHCDCLGRDLRSAIANRCH